MFADLTLVDDRSNISSIRSDIGVGRLSDTGTAATHRQLKEDSNMIFEELLLKIWDVVLLVLAMRHVTASLKEALVCQHAVPEPSEEQAPPPYQQVPLELMLRAARPFNEQDYERAAAGSMTHFK
jgi:hypothetical protein